jgi:hypothetical protein
VPQLANSLDYFRIPVSQIRFIQSTTPSRRTKDVAIRNACTKFSGFPSAGRMRAYYLGKKWVSICAPLKQRKKLTKIHNHWRRASDMREPHTFMKIHCTIRQLTARTAERTISKVYRARLTDINSVANAKDAF